MNLDNKLDEYSYLWNGSENWKLTHISGTRYTIIVHFEERVSVKELLTLRKIFPYFQNRKPQEIKDELASQSYWKSDGFNYHTGHRMYESIINEGLSAEIVGHDLRLYGIFNPDTEMTLKIYSAEIYEAVIEKMLAAGVHVDYVEID